METFRAIFDMAKRGLLRTKVEKTYSLGEIQEAVERAAQPKRKGKIIFEFNL
jgi:D-arabinose 1-dehydrogenase-like Zn-dependent alcohol dehydrogenase